MTVGQRIKQRRKELKISADELGKRLGKDRSTVFRYENGSIEKLPIDILEPIAKVLQTTPEYLMGWEEKIEKEPEKMAQLHFEILVDEDISDLFEEFKTLDGKERQLVKDLVHSLAKTKKEV